MSKLFVIFLLIVCISSILCLNCHFDGECTVNGVTQSCVNGSCVAKPGWNIPNFSSFTNMLPKAPNLPLTPVDLFKQVQGSRNATLAAGTCNKNIDCISTGLYQKCKKGKCVKDDHKLCVNNNDCKKNNFNKYCRDNKCTFNMFSK